MSGDDARNDLVPTHRLGLTTIIVRSDKPVGAADEATADLTMNSILSLTFQ